MLDEVGIVGFLLLVVALLSILVAFLPIRRGGNRSLYAALTAAAGVWAVHAGVDWDWEMPATTVWLFALGGAALARHERDPLTVVPVQGVRIAAGLALLFACMAPGFVLLSQKHLDTAVD